MLSFFRKVRRQLLSESPPAGRAAKSTRYLKYAAGEILLVVIGILIALQINNWNEQRKNNLAFEQLVTAFEGDLIDHIETSNNYLRYEYRKNTFIRMVLSDTLTRESYERKENRILRGPEFESEDGYYSQENLLDVLELIKKVPEKYRELEPILKDYKLAILNSNDIDGRVKKQIRTYRQKLTDTQPWLGRMDSISINQSIDYYLNDPFYRNHMFSYGKHISIAVFSASRIRALALGLLGKIKQIREGFDAAAITELFEELSCAPFTAFHCNDNINTTEREFTFLLEYLVYNMREEPISFIMDNPKSSLNSLQVEPGTFIHTPLFTPIIFGVKDPNGCIGKYSVAKDGFLIVE